MKKIIISLILVISLFVIGCADNKVIDGKTYKPYGFITKSEIRNPNIEYEIVFGNVVWSVLLAHTIVAPVYFAGFSLWEPVGLMGENDHNVKH
jgi:hypothetical protein